MTEAYDRASEAALRKLADLSAAAPQTEHDFVLVLTPDQRRVLQRVLREALHEALSAEADVPVVDRAAPFNPDSVILAQLRWNLA